MLYHLIIIWPWTVHITNGGLDCLIFKNEDNNPPSKLPQRSIRRCKWSNVCKSVLWSLKCNGNKRYYNHCNLTRMHISTEVREGEKGHSEWRQKINSLWWENLTPLLWQFSGNSSNLPERTDCCWQFPNSPIVIGEAWTLINYLDFFPQV